jgi:lactate dehydrogenase-like 2-hydroxyacid dehydrogenase
LKLTNNSLAYIPSGKLTAYLLSETHSVGKSKAKLFRSVGYNELNVSLLKESLLSIAHTEDILDTQSSEHGVKYVIEGMLQTPAGGTLKIRTVWIIDRGQDRPRFVTAYPV